MKPLYPRDQCSWGRTWIGRLQGLQPCKIYGRTASACIFNLYVFT